jgi:protein transport protein SEC61 subunit gamma-like protein
LGMKDVENSAEKKAMPAKSKSDLKPKLDFKNKLALKERLDLDEKMEDMGISVPSTSIKEYLRVLKLARKPSREEFSMIAKVSMAGIGVIGTMGFIIYAILTELPKVF